MISSKAIAAFELILGVMICIGGVVVYTEAKFAPKEMTFKLIDSESEERKVDIDRIEKKLDLIYKVLIDSKRR